MNIRPVHGSPRGATLTLFVEVYQDDDSDIDGTETVRAVAKAVNKPQDRPPGDAAADDLTFSVAWTPAAGDDLAGWHLEASATATAALDAGFYLADLRVVLAGGTVIQTNPIALDLRERVTEAA